MSSPTKIAFILAALFPAAPASADTFGSDGNQFDIEFLTIGDAGNPVSSSGRGAVSNEYRISKYEVSEAMIAGYNTSGGGPAITLDSRGPDKPATSVSWNEAARFVNWLNTSEGHSPAYKFTTPGANDNLTLWTLADGSAYDPSNPFRSREAYYFLPSEDEWYKAAYYDPAKDGTGGYWYYATATDSPPGSTTGGTVPGTAVWDNIVDPGPTGPADIDNAGGLSPYGTMAQSGNVQEWTESGRTPPNDSAEELRVFRGGYWGDYINGIGHTYAPADIPSRDNSTITGFRVASVPEPSALLLTLLGLVGFGLRRTR